MQYPSDIASPFMNRFGLVWDCWGRSLVDGKVGQRILTPDWLITEDHRQAVKVGQGHYHRIGPYQRLDGRLKLGTARAGLLLANWSQGRRPKPIRAVQWCSGQDQLVYKRQPKPDWAVVFMAQYVTNIYCSEIYTHKV